MFQGLDLGLQRLHTPVYNCHRYIFVDTHCNHLCPSPLFSPLFGNWGYASSSCPYFFDHQKIAEAQKQASEKLAQQQAMARTQIQFVPGSTVPPGVTIVPPPSATAARSLSTGLTTATSANPGGVQRPRKSKWDTTQSSADDSSSKRSRY